MYLSIGGDMAVRDRAVIGIFDLDNTTYSKRTRELLRRGWYLGFDGPITYKNAVKALDVIAACPTDRMLLETDSPYLSPVPNRGKRNDSRNLPYIAARIAEIKGMTTEEVAEVTLQNGKQLFGL